METQPFGFSVAEADGAATIRLSGEIDYAASLAIGPAIDRIASECDSELLFDLDRVTLIDSEGIKGSTRAIMTPAFQLKTHFGHKVARNKLSSIGLVIVVIEADGRHYFEVPMLTYDEVGEIAL